MSMERVDSFEINYADSATSQDLKLNLTTGAGEARLYIGSDEKKYDDFFEFNKIKTFFTFKKDLLEYLLDAKEEYEQQTQMYRKDISQIYGENLKKINAIFEEKLEIKFRKTFDKGNRYYLVIDDTVKENRKKYNYIRDICLPRVTKMCFVKLINSITREKTIYFKPIFFNNIDNNKNEEILIPKEITEDEQMVKLYKQKGREKQNTYRMQLLDQMARCIFTGVTDDRILNACHIKPYVNCNDIEKYDVANGIVMTPTYHSLFDIGFISFDDNGKLLISGFLSNLNREKLNLVEGRKYILQEKSKMYLKYHREKIFKCIPKID